MPSPPRIVSFGEILWDLLPSGKIAGGAPMNVAYHANQFGLRTQLVSRVGDDDPGRELLNFLDDKGIDTSLVQQDAHHPTGSVAVTLDQQGSPSYVIAKPAAWDFIEPSPAAREAVGAANALLYGSLACRAPASQATLLQLLPLSPCGVFDVNLRTPFYSVPLVVSLLQAAHLVKMNDEELALISTWLDAAEDEHAQMEMVRNHFDLDMLLVTKGARGAVLLNRDNTFWTHPGYKVTVQDTIGSGDAFLGAFLSGYFTGQLPGDCLDLACAAGAFVASQQGATPAYQAQQVQQMRSH